MSNLALFTTNQRSAGAVVTAANTLATPLLANLVLLWTSDAQGSVLSSVRARPRAQVAAAQLQLYGSTDNGASLELIDTAACAAWTLSTATEASKGDFGYTADNPLRTRANEKIYAGSAVALTGGFAFRAEGGDL